MILFWAREMRGGSPVGLRGLVSGVVVKRLFLFSFLEMFGDPLIVVLWEICRKSSSLRCPVIACLPSWKV